MAKKSSKSKGYRKSTAKKPYLSKRDIIILCAIIAVLVVGAILLFSYDDGALKTKGGAIVDKGENWLIVNGSNTSGGHRYFKLGEVGEMEGYELAITPNTSDSNLSQFTFTPTDEASQVRSVSIVGSPAAADRLALANLSMMSSIGTGEISEIAEAEADGRAYQYYTINYAYTVEEDAAEEADVTVEEAADEATDAAEDVASEATEAVEEAAGEATEAVEEAAGEATEAVEEAAGEATEAVEEAASDAAESDAGEADAVEPNRFEQSISAFMDAPKLGSVAVTIALDVDSAEDYLDEAALCELAAQAFAAVTFEEK